jgi:hypothetical protein
MNAFLAAAYEREGLAASTMAGHCNITGRYSIDGEDHCGPPAKNTKRCVS